jgi:hypothetical protein
MAEGKYVRLLLALLFLSGLAAIDSGSVRAQSATPSPTPRRALPKPQSGARGFEKYAGQDASSRLIAAGTTRLPVHPRQPLAPLQGNAYEATPFFAWEVAPMSRTYHFALYEGDVDKDPKAVLVHQADVTQSEYSYPKTARKLEPGKLYSWRISTPAKSGPEVGAAALIVVLGGKEAAEVKQALETAGLTAPTASADRLDQARVFENFGVWYDALRIATELARDPQNKEAQEYLESLLNKLDEETPGQ